MKNYIETGLSGRTKKGEPSFLRKLRFTENSQE